MLTVAAPLTWVCASRRWALMISFYVNDTNDVEELLHQLSAFSERGVRQSTPYVSFLRLQVTLFRVTHFSVHTLCSCVQFHERKRVRSMVDLPSRLRTTSRRRMTGGMTARASAVFTRHESRLGSQVPSAWLNQPSRCVCLRLRFRILGTSYVSCLV